jgi:hypothetical protein
LALRTPKVLIVIVSNLRPARPARYQVTRISSRGRHCRSQALVFLVLRPVLQMNEAYIRLVYCADSAQPGEEPANTTDKKPALASAGLTDQVASRRPYPPSSLEEVYERPG